MSRFKKATRTQARARIALVGPSGSGKTYTGLVFARELVGEGGRIAVIDTERGSASKYAGTVTDFDVLELDQHDPRAYMEALYEAGREGFDVVVIDSLTHAWSGRGGALELVDQAAARSKSSNSFAAWREVTPIHNQLVDAILTYPGHVIVTMRAKTEYVMETVNGKSVPRKVGLAPIQRDGMEYEFDVVADIDHDHTFVITKTRCNELDGLVVKKAGHVIAAKIRAWLEDGEPKRAPETPTERPAPRRADTTGDTKADSEVAAAMQRGSAADPALEAALLALVAVTDDDGMLGWLRVNAPLLRTLAKEPKKATWSAIVSHGASLRLDAAQLTQMLVDVTNEAERAA